MGFVDEKDEFIIEPMYCSVTPFYHGVSIVYYMEAYAFHRYHERWIVIDKMGQDPEMVCQPVGKMKDIFCFCMRIIWYFQEKNVTLQLLITKRKSRVIDTTFRG